MGDERYLRHPSKQALFRLLAPVMSIICLNAQYWKWYKLPSSKLFRLQRIMIPIFSPITCFSQVIYLIKNYKSHDFAVLAVIMSITPVALTVWLKNCVAQTKSYKKVSTAFMQEIHLHNLYVKKNPAHKQNYIKNTLIKIEKATYYTFCIMGFFYFCCYCSWSIVPVMKNVQTIESIHNITTRLQFVVYIWTPYIDYEYNFYAYLFMQALGVYLGAIAMTTIVTFDVINLTLIYHLTGHVQILKYDLLKDKNETLSEIEWKHRIKHYSTTYYFITKSLQDIQAAFGFNVLTIYVQNLLQGGLLLYQLMSFGKDTGVTLMYGLMIPSFTGMLILMSVVLENFRIQADDIPSLVYDLPWETMSVRNQKMLRSVLFQVQPTLEFIAAFNVKTGVQPAINILKTTFSYYVMIKSKNEEID